MINPSSIIKEQSITEELGSPIKIRESSSRAMRDLKYQPNLISRLTTSRDEELPPNILNTDMSI